MESQQQRHPGRRGEDDVLSRLSVHEAVCAERYASIEYRLSRIEKAVLIGMWTALCGVLTLVISLAVIALQHHEVVVR